MYRVNPLMRNTLITTDEVIFHAETKETLDPRMVQQNIILAEERFIRPFLGLALYQDICNQKNEVVDSSTVDEMNTDVNKDLPEGAEPAVVVIGDIVNAMEFLDADYLSLWKQYLWKLCAECVMFMCVPGGFIQFGNEGITHAQPQSGSISAAGAVTPALKSVQWMMDKKLMDRIDPLKEATRLFICGNNGNYSLYTTPCECDDGGIASNRKSDIVLGLYDDVDRNYGGWSKTGPAYGNNNNNCGQC